MPTRGNIDYDQIGLPPRSGDGSGLLTTKGTLTSGHGLVIDATGNAVDSGSVPGGGGGAGLPGGVIGLSFWVDASQIVGLSDGNPITSWLDMATGDALSPSGSVNVVYKTAILNGKPVARLTAVSAAGLYNNFVIPVDTPQYSILMVVKLSSLGPSYTALWGSTNTTCFLVKSTGKTALYLNNSNIWDGSGAATFSVGTFYIVSLIIGPTTASCRVALAADNSNTISSTSNGRPFQLGWQFGQSGRELSGDIAEMLVYRHALSTSDNSLIENYLKTKYGL